MEIEFKENKIIFDRELSLLDSFVLSFTEHLVILIEHISFEKFLKFWSEIEPGYECINTDNSYESYNDYLKNQHAIRIVKKGSFIPTLNSNL